MDGKNADMLMNIKVKKFTENEAKRQELEELYVRQMEEADMEIASEFLEMAARLVYLKSVSLLPVYTEAEARMIPLFVVSSISTSLTTTLSARGLSVISITSDN